MKARLGLISVKAKGEVTHINNVAVKTLPSDIVLIIEYELRKHAITHPFASSSKAATLPVRTFICCRTLLAVCKSEAADLPKEDNL